jgi:hypothetical protein
LRELRAAMEAGDIEVRLAALEQRLDLRPNGAAPETRQWQ